MTKNEVFIQSVTYVYRKLQFTNRVKTLAKKLRNIDHCNVIYRDNLNDM